MTPTRYRLTCVALVGPAALVTGHLVVAGAGLPGPAGVAAGLTAGLVIGLPIARYQHRTEGETR
ncbi:hypothetical protein [Streptomyces sioyaensis]|uniref:hypothetical protein n=1 Tax=Streptomyces sioyaensis TaxID=67364 RepID=UPI0036EF50A1